MQYIVKDVKDFNLDHIFDCGQCFRWEKQEDESYVGAALGKVVRVSMQGKDVIIDNCTEEDYNKQLRNYYRIFKKHLRNRY